MSVLGSETSSESEGDKEKAEPKAKKGKAKRKGKVARQVSHGKAYVQATYNNTIITITDLNGNAIAWASAGSVGFKGPKKSTPYAASLVVKRVAEKSEAYGLKEVNVYISGVGQGRDSAVRSMNANGLTVLSIRDVTPIPHNGCRKPRTRRV
ncbi:MAG: 30S ribosomal protein S11 [bacterium]|nr:30S ribosomal protein S11 [bacterium]